MEYRDKDSELIYLINEGNEEERKALYNKYNPFIKSVVSKMVKYCKNTGLEENDLYQEGMLGLTNAIKNYDETKDNKFYTYAKTCIEKKIISAIVASKRIKHRAMNESIFIDDADNSIFKIDGPEEMIIDIENETEMLNNIRNELTDFEDQVLLLKIGGLKKKEISEVLERDDKAVDNALQRIRVKVRKIINK